jgi:hypothetical protein
MHYRTTGGDKESISRKCYTMPTSTGSGATVVGLSTAWRMLRGSMLSALFVALYPGARDHASGWLPIHRLRILRA